MPASAIFRYWSALVVLLLPACLAAQTVVVDLVSKSIRPGSSTGGDTLGAELGADGQWAVLISSASAFVDNDTNGLVLDLFLRNIPTGQSTLITRAADGAGADDHSYSPMISGEGRWVLFESLASNLVAGDENGGSDVFSYDRETGQLSRISAAGEDPDGQATLLAASSDVRFAVFSSTADGLVPNDANEGADLFVWERGVPGLRLVTTDHAGTRSAAAAINPPEAEAAISNDGRYIAHISLPRDLAAEVPATLTNLAQLFLWDRTTGQNTLLSPNAVDPTLTSPTSAGAPVFSADGSRLAFVAVETPRPGQDVQSLWLYTLSSKELKRVPHPSGSAAANALWRDPSLNADGSLLAFVYGEQIAVHEPGAGMTRIISTNAAGLSGNGPSDSPKMTVDGNLILFESLAGDLTPEDTLGTLQVLQWDRRTGRIGLVSRAHGSAQGANSDATFSVVNADGRWAAFISQADNLVMADSPRLNDAFLVNLSNGNVILLSTPPSSGNNDAANGPSQNSGFSLSLNGRLAVFSSAAADIVPEDQDTAPDLFLRDLRSRSQVTRLVNQPLERATNSIFAEVNALSGDGAWVIYGSREFFPETNCTCVIAYHVGAQSREVISVNADGVPFGKAGGASASLDGRFVAFVTERDGTFRSGAYLRDLVERTTLLLEPSYVNNVLVSPSGRYVLIETRLPQLIRFDFINLVLYDRQTGIKRNLASHKYDGNPFSRDEEKLLLLAPTARNVYNELYLFSTATLASNRVATGVDGPAVLLPDGATAVYRHHGMTETNVVIHDLAEGTRRPLMGPAGPVERLRSAVPSADGRYLAMMVAGRTPSDQFNQIYVHDFWLTNTFLASRTPANSSPNGPSGGISLSADGRTISFDSLATDLVVRDLNGQQDVFVARLTGPDDDANGLDDGWERRFLPANGSAGSAAGDFDGDGASQLEEFHAGTHPAHAGSALRLRVLWLDLSQANAAIEWHGVLGKAYQLQRRSLLGTGGWEDVGPIHMATVDGAITHRIDRSGSDRAFYRVLLR